MRRIVIVGGSIAAVTAASTLRVHGFTGDVVVVSEEEAPYSRVPLSKGIIAGTQTPADAVLPALPPDVHLRTRARATALHPGRQVVELADGSSVAYDGLVVATGSRARRLAASGQEGELVLRTLADAEAIVARLVGARSAVVVGAGFLGMEIASTLRRRGLGVTVVDREPPLLRLLGRWLSSLLTTRAREEGIRFVLAPAGVTLVGNPVQGVDCGLNEGPIEADVVISAVGDLPNVEWLATSGLPVRGGLVVDRHCRVAREIVAAGDATVVESAPGIFRRTPHWTIAVAQGRAAALALIEPTAPASPLDHYFWTEQFGFELKLAGELPYDGPPHVLAGGFGEGSALLQWRRGGAPVAAAAMNYRMPIAKLKALAQPARLARIHR